jgi:uncharacterized protein YkwD
MRDGTTGAWLRRWLLLGLCVSISMSSGTAVSDAQSRQAFSDTKGHWAQDTIAWGVEAGVVNGFPGGAFQPNGQVTEAQFLAMLFRAFPDVTPAQAKPYWYSAYFAKAADWLWPVDERNANLKFLRGNVAQLVAASQGRQLPVDDAIAFLLKEGLAKGRLLPDGRVEFGAYETLTRAEAVQFVRNVASVGQQVRSADKPPAASAAPAKSDAAVSVAGISIGDSEQRVLQVMGEPARKDVSEYGFAWYVYNKDYREFSMIGIKNGKVVGLYANGSSLTVKELRDTSLSLDVQRVLGTPLTAIRKGNTRYLINGKGEYETFDTETAYVTVFYDVHEGGVITGAQAIEKKTELSLAGFYGTSSARLRQSFERQTLDLTNSARALRGLPALAWDDGAAVTAAGHSADMAENGFFDHTNLRGETLGDRLAKTKVSYRSAGENIAYGQTSAIFAHEGWMNSMGHRKNILAPFERLGVGVVFTDGMVPYYTQNFITRLR